MAKLNLNQTDLFDYTQKEKIKKNSNCPKNIEDLIFDKEICKRYQKKERYKKYKN